MKYKLPKQSERNNKYFHPIISNGEYVKLLGFQTLPVLNKPKDYREKIARYNKKLLINSNEVRRYTDLYNQVLEFKHSQPTASSYMNTEDKTVHDQKNTLVIEVIKAWHTSNSKHKKSASPIIEIQKLSEYGSEESESHLADNDECEISEDNYIW